MVLTEDWLFYVEDQQVWCYTLSSIYLTTIGDYQNWRVCNCEISKLVFHAIGENAVRYYVFTT